MKKLLITSALASLTLSANAYAGVTVYTSQSAFEAALGGFTTTEDFADTTLVSGLTFTSTNGNINGGKFYDKITSAGATTTFSFANGTNAFGGTFDLSLANYGSGLKFLIDGTTLVGSIKNTPTGFFGFISDSAFSAVKIASSTPGQEIYSLTNLVVGQSDVPGAVPEPATWALMILGFGAVAGAMRQRRAKVTFNFA